MTVFRLMFALAVAASPVAGSRAPAVGDTALPPQLLPVYGGAGGTAFTRSCGAGRVLSGLRYRDGLLVDALGLLCRPVLSDGTLGPETTVGSLVGGGGGTSGSVSCSSGRVVMGVRIYAGAVVNGLMLYCNTWQPAIRSWGGTAQYASRIGGASATTYNEECEAKTQPANGIRGRAGLVVDAIGFICDEP